MLFTDTPGLLDLDVVAGITDPGGHRDHNEDAIAVGTLGPAAAAVVCDGVASSPGSGVAAAVAAEAGLRTLLAAVARGEEPVAAITAGMVAAAEVAAAVTAPDPDDPPGCTYVSALVDDTGVTVGWVGDSPAYWADPTGTRRLTVDDTPAGGLLADGATPDDPRLSDPAAHALARWLGADAGDAPPHVHRFVPDGPGLVVLCSDGLSRYLDAGLIAPVDHQGTPADTARTLLDSALAAGGHDNVTVAVIAASIPGEAAG